MQILAVKMFSRQSLSITKLSKFASVNCRHSGDDFFDEEEWVRMYESYVPANYMTAISKHVCKAQFKQLLDKYEKVDLTKNQKLLSIESMLLNIKFRTICK